MPTKEEWSRVHANLTAKLNLPCKLRFTEHVKIARHITEGDFTFRGMRDVDYVGVPHVCYIDINPTADFRVPEHLILHEGAHHRALELDEYHGHDEVWARILCKMYVEAGVALPYSTGFEAFAEAAGIKYKIYEAVGKETVLIEKQST